VVFYKNVFPFPSHTTHNKNQLTQPNVEPDPPSFGSEFVSIPSPLPDVESSPNPLDVDTESSTSATPGTLGPILLTMALPLRLLLYPVPRNMLLGP